MGHQMYSIRIIGGSTVSPDLGLAARSIMGSQSLEGSREEKVAHIAARVFP